MVKDQLMRRGIISPHVLGAFSLVPRDQFVLTKFIPDAYKDAEVPTPFGQALDRPYENALMLEALELKNTDRVLEVGTGSGYTAALISRIAQDVFTIEIEPKIAEDARKNLQKLGYANVEVKTADGYLGWPEKAPFTKIMMACSPSKVPSPLVSQLAEGGLLLAPIGGTQKFQILTLFKKQNGRLLQIKTLSPTSFTPMKGKITEK